MIISNKLNIWTVLLLGALGFSSCSLDEKDLYKPVPEAIFSNATGIGNGVSGVYSTLRQLYGSEPGFTVTEMGTDIFQHGKDGSFKFMDDYSTAFNPNNSYLSRIWNSCYAGINTANTVLDKIDGVAMDEALKTRYKAEVRFLRAHYYYWLTMQFGDAVYSEHETKGVVTNAGRTSKDTIWKRMQEDTKFAIDNLGWTTTDYGRVTKGAALHQLAKIDLLLKDYKGASDAALELINNGPYKLQSTYAAVFDYANQQNSEIVFATQYLNNALYNGPGNGGHAFFTPAYDQFGLTRDLNQGGRPYTRFRPTVFFRELFEPNDTRFDVTFRYTWFYNNAATTPPGKKVGDTVVWTISPGLTSTIAPNTDNMHWAIKKHDDPTRSSPQDLSGFRDFFVYRLSETYLIAAEALMMQQEYEEGVKWLNKVRDRAAKPGTTLPQLTAAQLNIDAILDERARELGGEEDRWMELVRTGKLLERAAKYNPNAKNIQPHHVLRPIPQEQIDLSTNKFEQNDGY
ncbi:RagB/SusD family nutrient uptake outer membrane protein [Chitinophaga filiformis]|uniref:RagB/SusD family nutrient uptake outer membrane protein n=1 Tax=Chitinophaga filiformis TaxID=104663 RepID=UPI001F3A6C06|nr:RagB/SusD family nutrient uptake outer membrane protein [Chitinophaga filiformis]MCF6405238.1 RagB/SusD family nutrient uptake outer membrane protein [Chitinophaga filiformis]